MIDQLILGLWAALMLCGAAFLFRIADRDAQIRMIRRAMLDEYREDYPETCAWLEANAPPAVMRSLAEMRFQLEKFSLFASEHEHCQNKTKVKP